MKTRFTFDPLDGEFKDRHGNSIGVIASITLDLEKGALERMAQQAELRVLLWERADNACEHCGYENEDALDMHHRTYERLGHEDLDDVELLCRNCHRKEHDRLVAAGTPLHRPNRSVGLGRSLPFSSSTSTSEEKNVVEGRGVGEPERPTATQLEREAVRRIWDYYLQVIPSRRTFDAKRERIIRNALRVVGEDSVKRAILGLSRSPWHNGENPDRKKYLELRHALKGRGDESDDERIEKAITWATIYAPGSNGIDGAKVERWLDQVRYHLSKRNIDPGSLAGRERAEEAYHKLKAAGFTLRRLDRPPYVEVSR